MAVEKKGFTFIWRIKKLSFYWQEPKKGFNSVPFVVDTMEGTQWRVGMWPKSVKFENRTYLYLERGKEDKGPEEFILDFELSILACDGSAVVSGDFYKQIFRKGEWSSPFLLNRDEMFKQKIEAFFPGDVLTIRCKMWKSQGFVKEDGRSFALTRFIVTERSFVGIIEGFSDLETDVSKAIRIRTASTEIQFFSMNISCDYDGKIYLEMIPITPQQANICKCRLFIIDAVGNKVKCGKDEFILSNIKPGQSLKFPLSVTKEKLINFQTQYLPNDSLSFQCEIAFSAGKVYQRIEKTEYSATLFTNTHPTIVTFEDVNNSEKESKSLLICEDLLSFYRKGVMYDTQLQVGSKSFPVHSLILSIRSPVFSDMLSQNKMKVIQLEDLDAESVQSMLTFMYSDTLDNLECERVKKLYFAAIKYDIVSLKYRCSTFLKDNLFSSNICDVLLLADQYQDDDLKKIAQSYIATHSKAILDSDQWKNLEKNYPTLTMETFRMIYLRKWRN